MRGSRVLALILVILIFPVGTVWAQQTIYGCVKNANGQVRIVSAGERCLPSEHATQWSASTTTPPPAVVPPPEVPPPPAAPGPLRVVDSNGDTLGLLVSTDSGNAAARLVGDTWLALPLTPAGFQVTNPFGLLPFYSNGTCSGDAYLPVDALLRSGFVMPAASGQLAFSYPSKPDVDRSAIKAYSYYDGATWVCVAYNPPDYMPLFGKVATFDVSTFVVPFKIVQ